MRKRECTNDRGKGRIRRSRCVATYLQDSQLRSGKSTFVADELGLQLFICAMDKLHG